MNDPQTAVGGIPQSGASVFSFDLTDLACSNRLVAVP